MPDGRPSAALSRRVRLAVDLFHQGYASQMVLTGGFGEPPPPLSEAEAAARLCVQWGVPKSALHREEASRDTLQNAEFAARLVSGHVLVVSDTYHAFRCARVFGRHFEHADAVGVPPPDGQRVRLALREVLNLVRHAVRRSV